MAARNQNNAEATALVSRMIACQMNLEVVKSLYGNQGLKKEKPKCSYCGMLEHLQSVTSSMGIPQATDWQRIKLNNLSPVPIKLLELLHLTTCQMHFQA